MVHKCKHRSGRPGGYPSRWTEDRWSSKGPALHSFTSDERPCGALLTTQQEHDQHGRPRTQTVTRDNQLLPSAFHELHKLGTSDLAYGLSGLQHAFMCKATHEGRCAGPGVSESIGHRRSATNGQNNVVQLWIMRDEEVGKANASLCMHQMHVLWCQRSKAHANITGRRDKVSSIRKARHTRCFFHDGWIGTRHFRPHIDRIRVPFLRSGLLDHHVQVVHEGIL
mmetsp:Transcript_37946/g.101109  ORF Transcript_37946/g.101109 Transcript_37946/m.101109 type:complete len:224 (+) Transcript_37946:572-1243(+)